VAEPWIVKKDLLCSAYPGHIVLSVINKRPKNRVMQKYSDKKPVCMVSIPCVRGISEKFKRTSERYNIRTSPGDTSVLWAPSVSGGEVCNFH